MTNRPPIVIHIPDSRTPRQRRDASRSPQSHRQSPRQSHRSLIWWFLALTTAGVLFCGMFPFDFVFHFATATAEIRRRFDTTIDQLYTAGDGLENVIFFVPTGFALAGLFWNGRRTDWLKLAMAAGLAIACGAALSSIVELSQVFLLSRDPSLADICSNTTGTAVGFAIFFCIGPAVIDAVARFFTRLYRRLTPRNLHIAAAVWLLAAILLPLVRGDVGSLAGWSPAYPLMIGNETTGDRFWNGTVRSCWIADHALTDDEIDTLLTGADPTATMGAGLLSAYHFDGRGPYADTHGLGGTLHWIGGKGKVNSASGEEPSTKPSEAAPPMLSGFGGSAIKGAPTGDGWWLLSEDGTESAVSHRIAKSNAFTLIVDVQTDDLGQQNGPPRIISISRDTDRCNLQLLQNADALTIRLRTAVTGEGGSDPEFVLPDVFTDTAPQRIAVTFDRGRLMPTSSRLSDHNAFEFNPESSLIWQIYPRPGWAFRLDSGGQNTCAKIYRAFAILPIGLLLALATSLRVQNGLSRERGRFDALVEVVAACVALEFALFCAENFHATVGTILVTLILGVVSVVVTQRFAPMQVRPM